VIDAGEGVVRYLAKTLSHGLKREQAPPLGWRGHRTSQTRGYLVRPASVMREEARESLARKRDLARLSEAIADPYDLELALHDAAQLRRDTTWTLYRLPRAALVQPLPRTRDSRPAASAAAFVGRDGTASPESGAKARRALREAGSTRGRLPCGVPLGGAPGEAVPENPG
jgi:hypothetical protein